MSDAAAAGWGRGTHDLVWIEGTDAVSFIDGQLSQDVAAMRPGEVGRSLLLEPRGKLRGVLWVLRGEASVGLITWKGTGQQVAADLEGFRFRVEATISVDSAAGHSEWGQGHGVAGWVGDRSGLRAITPRGRAPDAVIVGALPTGPALTAGDIALHRVLSGEPVFGIDVDEDTIPQETGLVAEAVSFTKGCFLGQELVGRIESRGHVNRMLRRVRIGGGVPPRGAEITLGQAPVGTLGTVAPVPGGAETLAMVRRQAAAGARVVVRWDGGEATGEIVEIAREPSAG